MTEKLQCQMSNACEAEVTHLGAKGYLYCKPHGQRRRGYERTRALRAWELRWIREGRTLPSYAPGPEPKLQEV